MQQFLKFIFGIKLYMFRTVPLSIIRSSSLYTQQWYMSYRFADSLRAGSGMLRPYPARKLSAHIPLLCVQWKIPNDRQRNCSKHVEFYSKNKFEKISASSWFYYKNLSRCTVIGTSNINQYFTCFVGMKLSLTRRKEDKSSQAFW